MEVSPKMRLLTNCVKSIMLANKKFLDLRKGCKHIVDTLVDRQGNTTYICSKLGKLCDPSCCILIRQ